MNDENEKTNLTESALPRLLARLREDLAEGRLECGGDLATRLGQAASAGAPGSTLADLASVVADYYEAADGMDGLSLEWLGLAAGLGSLEAAERVMRRTPAEDIAAFLAAAERYLGMARSALAELPGNRDLMRQAVGCLERVGKIDKARFRAWMGDFLCLFFSGAVPPDKGEDGASPDLEAAVAEAYRACAVPAVLLVPAGIPEGKSRDTREALNHYQILAQSPTPLAVLPEDLFQAGHVLGQEFPWFEDLTRKIVDCLFAAAHGHGVFKLPNLLLAGEPGIGKTRYLGRLAALFGVPLHVHQVSGSSDNKELIGASRAWSTGTASLPVRVIRQHGLANPLIAVDEIDKASPNRTNGCVWDALLTLTEPSSSRIFSDEFLQAAVDLSHVN